MTIASAPAAPTANLSRGLVMLLVAILCGTAMDALAKAMVARYGTMEVVWARYSLQGLGLVLWQARRLKRLVATRRPVLQLVRSLCQFGSIGFFFASLGFIGLASATAIADLAPCMITLGAALFLGERIGPHRAGGVAAAFIGALIIIRPGSEVFTPASLLALASATCYAAYALLTRAVGTGEPMLTALFYSTIVGAVLTTLALPFFWQPVALADLPFFVGIGALGVLVQFFLIRAFSLAEASAIAPYGLTDLLFAATWGMIFFGEFPDRWTILGALVIATAGLYVWHRERRGAVPRAPQTGP